MSSLSALSSSRLTQRDGRCTSPRVSPSPQQPRCPYILLLSKILTTTEPSLGQSRLQELKCWCGKGGWSAREPIATSIGKGGGDSAPEEEEEEAVPRTPGDPDTIAQNNMVAVSGRHTVGLQYCQPFWDWTEGSVTQGTRLEFQLSDKPAAGAWATYHLLCLSFPIYKIIALWNSQMAPSLATMKTNTSLINK